MVCTLSKGSDTISLSYSCARLRRAALHLNGGSGGSLGKDAACIPGTVTVQSESCSGLSELR